METNIPQIARAIFGRPTAAAAGSIQLGLEDCAGPDASAVEQAEIISEVLMFLFLQGIKIKYSQDTRPADLTPAQLETLSKYTQSYGFYFTVESHELMEPPNIPDEPRTQLKDFSERFYDFKRGLWHELAFDWARLGGNAPRAGHQMTRREF